MIQLKSHRLDFHFEAGTSRGVLTNKTSYFLRIEQDGREGIGEAGPLRGLSPEFEEDCTERFRAILDGLPALPVSIVEIPTYLENIPFQFPSLRMAMEMALIDWIQGGNGQYFDNTFSTKETPDNPSTKGSIKFKGILHLITEGDMIIAKITNN